MKIIPRSRRFRVALFAGALSAAGIAIASAEDVWVNRPKLPIRSDPSPSGDIVGVAPQGAKLSVTAHGGPANKWINVNTPGEAGKELDGWVAQGSTSQRDVGAASGGVGESSASALSVGAASKGLEPDADKYIDAKHVSKEPVLKMRASTRGIKAAALQKFMTEGHVGAS